MSMCPPSRPVSVVSGFFVLVHGIRSDVLFVARTGMVIRLYVYLCSQEGNSIELAVPRGPIEWPALGLISLVPEESLHPEEQRLEDSSPSGATIRWVRYGAALPGAGVGAGGSMGGRFGRRGGSMDEDEPTSPSSSGTRLARLAAQFSPLLRRLGSLPVRNALANLMDAVDRSIP
jgi:hypothetical protein